MSWKMGLICDLHTVCKCKQYIMSPFIILYVLSVINSVLFLVLLIFLNTDVGMNNDILMMLGIIDYWWSLDGQKEVGKRDLFKIIILSFLLLIIAFECGGGYNKVDNDLGVDYE